MARTEIADALYVELADLQVGMHVHLDLSWLEHPFPKSSFRIRTAEQIATIRTLKLTRVRWSPALSDLASGNGSGSDATPSSEAHSPADASRPAAPSQDRPSRAAVQRDTMQACQKALAEAVRQVKGLSKTLHAQPVETRDRARDLVDRLAGDMLEEADIAIRLMADQAGGESLYHHALNVTLLSLMLARAMNAPKSVMHTIGLGALFHDIGKFDIPARITRKTEPLTRAEAAWLRTHAAAGGELGKKMLLSPEVIQIITQHHELADGSGFPKKLKGSDIALPARIVAVANAYDNLCNALNPQAVLTPHEALATLYGKRRAQFDEKVLGTFVRCMGIYPPGSIVRLSDDRLGVVVSVNSSRPLKPTVMLFDPTVPRDRAPVLELDEVPELSISKTLRPQDVTPQACEYLLTGGRTPYYFSVEQRQSMAA